jgi:ribosomal protein L11 methyltransferase
MSWFSVSIRCKLAFSEIIADLLETKGAAGVEISDELLRDNTVGTIEEPLSGVDHEAGLEADRYVSVTGYFAHSAYEPGEMLDLLAGGVEHRRDIALESGMDPGEIEITLGHHDEKDWEAAWKLGFHQLRAGKHMLVVPPWETAEALPGDHVISMDPGMAFGTGTHPTTRMCLELLEEAVQQGDIVADVGTGSGILAIGAALLGAKHIFAWDYDPVAIEAAVTNVEKNLVTDRVTLFVQMSGSDEGKPERVTQEIDLVVANIAADTLVIVRPLVESLLPSRGRVVLSGIICEKAQMVIDAYAEAGFLLLKKLVVADWVALLLKKGEA